jgi:hypothetical protein
VKLVHPVGFVIKKLDGSVTGLDNQKEGPAVACIDLEGREAYRKTLCVQ